MSGERRYPDGTIDQPWWRIGEGETMSDWNLKQFKRMMTGVEIALDNPDVLAVNILRLWDREQIERFAQHLLGQECQGCTKYKHSEDAMTQLNAIENGNSPTE